MAERPSEMRLIVGFLVGALLGAYAMWAGPLAALVVVAFGVGGVLAAVGLSFASRIDLRRLAALLTEEER